jgi:hypothetical protein
VDAFAPIASTAASSALKCAPGGLWSEEEEEEEEDVLTSVAAARAGGGVGGGHEMRSLISWTQPYSITNSTNKCIENKKSTNIVMQSATNQTCEPHTFTASTRAAVATGLEVTLGLETLDDT